VTPAVITLPGVLTQLADQYVHGRKSRKDVLFCKKEPENFCALRRLPEQTIFLLQKFLASFFKKEVSFF
jgi:hypothetical protein